MEVNSMLGYNAYHITNRLLYLSNSKCVVVDRGHRYFVMRYPHEIPKRQYDAILRYSQTRNSDKRNDNHHRNYWSYRNVLTAAWPSSPGPSPSYRTDETWPQPYITIVSHMLILNMHINDHRICVPFFNQHRPTCNLIYVCKRHYNIRDSFESQLQLHYKCI